jgi:hypothetical protein
MSRQFGTDSCAGTAVSLVGTHPNHVDLVYRVLLGEPGAPQSTTTIVQAGSEICMPRGAPALPLSGYDVEPGRVRFFILGNLGGPLISTDWITDDEETQALVHQLAGRRPGENEIARAAARNADPHDVYG